MNFAVLWLFAKVFSTKFGGMASFGAAKASNPWKFSPWKSYFHESTKVFRYTVSIVLPFLEGINWSLHPIRTVNNEAAKYRRGGKLSQEKTFANWWKIRFLQRNGLLAGDIKGCHTPKISRIATKSRNSRKFSPSKVSLNWVFTCTIRDSGICFSGGERSIVQLPLDCTFCLQNGILNWKLVPSQSIFIIQAAFPHQ